MGAETKNPPNNQVMEVNNDTLLNTVINNPKYKLSIRSLSVLLPRGLTQAQIAKIYGISDSAVSHYIERHYAELAPILDRSGELLSQEFKGLAVRLVQSVKGKDINKASLRDRMVSAGIATDKSQVLQGLPSDITATITITPEEALALRRNSAADADRIIREGSK